VAQGRTVVETKDVDMELLYAALIAYPANLDACQFMAEHRYDISEAKMDVYRRRCSNPATPLFEGYQKRREQLAPRLEARLADDMLANAQRATNAEAYCIERIEDLLKEDRVQDPSRVARDLSQIRTQSIDKRLALQGRPTAITEHRSVDELARSLVAMNVAEIVESTAEEDPQ
jgi:hypothetical protein